jgi:signal peptide peptidase SppA
MNMTILRKAFAEPWAIAPENLALITQMILHGEPTDRPARELAAMPGYGAYNFEGALAAHQQRLPAVGPGVHVALLWGMLGRAWSADERAWMDAIDVDDVIEDIERSKADTVVLWFRSPGGISSGMSEAAASLRDIAKTKKVIAFTDDLMASAAYWLGSQADAIHATPTASIGSIGVYMAFYDFTGYLEKNGVSLELFKAGRLKAMGLPGNPLSDEERAFLQARVEETYEQFKTEVKYKRPLDDETMQGQTFSGAAALRSRLVDGFHRSAGEFFRSFKNAI